MLLLRSSAVCGFRFGLGYFLFLFFFTDGEDKKQLKAHERILTIFLETRSSRSGRAIYDHSPAGFGEKAFFFWKTISLPVHQHKNTTVPIIQFS